MMEVVLPRQVRRALLIGLTLAAVTGAFALVPVIVMQDRHLHRMREDLLDELARVEVLDQKARAALSEDGKEPWSDALIALVSPDATAGAAHLQAVVHAAGAAPVVIASIRNAPPLAGPILSASRVAVDFTDVPAASIASIVTGLEHATPRIMIESLRIVADNRMSDSGSGPVSVQVTATLRAYYKTSQTAVPAEAP